LQSLSTVGIQVPPPNPYWVNGATPPVSRPGSSASAASLAATQHNIDNSVARLTFNDLPTETYRTAAADSAAPNGSDLVLEHERRARLEGLGR